MKLIPIFSGSNGLNTKIDPVRIRFDPGTGISDLSACVNIDIDDSGRISRRKGYTATSRIEAWENLFSCGSYALGTKGNALCVIEADMSYTAIRNVTTGASMSFVRDTDGEQDVIFYNNGYETGKILNKTSYSWIADDYVGPTSRKEIYDPPLGHLLEIRNLRMFIAEGNILWYSEPGALSQFRLAANYFGFPSRLKMVKAVSSAQGGGLWVSDSESLFWLGGNIMPTANEMPLQVKLADYPAVENTAVIAPGSRIGKGVQGEVVVFATTKGICLGDSNGNLTNLTERKVDIPSGISGAGLYRDGRFITTIN